MERAQLDLLMALCEVVQGMASPSDQRFLAQKMLAAQEEAGRKVIVTETDE